FTERVDEKSKVLIIAPKGTVEFSTPPNTRLFDEGSKVDGDSLVVIVANSVTFRAKVDSDNARVFVILTTCDKKPGALTFADNMGEKTRAYWCTDGRAPEPVRPPKNRQGNVERRSLDDIFKLIQEHGFVGDNWLNKNDLQYLKWYLIERPK